MPIFEQRAVLAATLDLLAHDAPLDFVWLDISAD